jgi:CBS domain-containing protein
MLQEKVSLLMSVQPVVANQFHNFSQIVQLFSQYSLHHLPIVDGNNKVVGIVSSNDIPKVLVRLNSNAEKNALDFDVIDTKVNIAEIMTPNPAVVTAEDTLQTVVKLCVSNKCLALPVVENEKLIGIISLRDIASYLAA